MERGTCLPIELIHLKNRIINSIREFQQTHDKSPYKVIIREAQITQEFKTIINIPVEYLPITEDYNVVSAGDKVKLCCKACRKYITVE